MTIIAPEAPTIAPAEDAPVEVPARELETSKPLSLSEALRLGAMSTTQVTGKLGSVTNGTGEACGVGAVFAGLGYSFTGNTGIGTMTSRHPELNALNVRVDAAAIAGCGHLITGGTVLNAIVHLNDEHKMPRNEIADRLESLGL